MVCKRQLTTMQPSGAAHDQVQMSDDVLRTLDQQVCTTTYQLLKF